VVDGLAGILETKRQEEKALWKAKSDEGKKSDLFHKEGP
jgi:hypothetical protein